MYQFDVAISSAVEVDGATPPAAGDAPVKGPLSSELMDRMHRYWLAANYLTIGQIYLQHNPLLREPLRPEPALPLRARSRAAGEEPGGRRAPLRRGARD